MIQPFRVACLFPHPPLPHASFSALDQDDVVFFEQKVGDIALPAPPVIVHSFLLSSAGRS